MLIADVSEHSIGSIFKGRSMNFDRGWDVWDIYTGPGSGRSVAEPMAVGCLVVNGVHDQTAHRQVHRTHTNRWHTTTYPKKTNDEAGS
jgi:hypothetical protein